MARRAHDSAIPSRELFDKNPLPMWVFDLETLAFLAVNAAAVRQYGYSREEFLAMTIKEIRPPEEVPALLEKISRTAEGYDAAGTWRHRKRDGTIVDVEIVSQALRFAGRPARLILANDVTERKRLELALRRTADEWRQTVDAMSDAVAWIDPAGRIVRCNKAMTMLVKKDCQEIVGRPCWEIIHGTPGRIAGCPVEETMVTLKQATSTLRLGEQVFRVTADPLLDESGRFVGAVHIMTDVTQQEQAGKALRDMVLRQQAILNNIPDIAWLKDDQNRFLAVNEPFGRASGFAPADLVGKTDLDIWPRELAERYRADDAEVMRSRTRKVVEEPLADKAGKTAWIETIKTPIIDEAGRVVGTTGIARDITVRKQAEMALQASEKKFRTLFEAANDAIFILDLHGRFIDVNTVAHERLGYTREEMLSKNVAEFDSPEFAARVPERIAQIRKHGKAVFETAHLRRDGSVMQAEVNSVLIDHEGREVLYSIVRDITERKRGEKEILAASGMLDVISRVQSQVIVDAPPTDVFNNLLESLLRLTSSVYGFIGEVLSGPSGAPILRTHAISDIAWNQETRALYDKQAPHFEFTNLKTLFGEVIVTGKPVIANDPAGDPRRGGLPPGHPALESFLGLPIYHGGTLLGMVGIANCPGGYDEKVVEYLQPLLSTCGSIIAAYRNEARRKQAEEEIARSEERYRNLFDSANDMIQSVAPDGHFLYVNDAWRKTLGYDEDDLRSLSLFDIIHPSCKVFCEDLFTRAMSGEQIDFLEAKFVCKQGRIVEVEGSVAVRKDGNTILSTQGIFRDVTERKKLQEEVFRISHDWEETFNTITDMVTVHDKDFNIIRANTAAGKILGLPFLQGTPVKCFEYYHGTVCPPAGCPSCSSLVTGTSTVSEMFEPHLGRHIEIRAIPRFDSAGQFAGLIHIVRDITERTQAEAAKKEQMLLAEFGMHIGTALNKEGSVPEILGACTDFMISDLDAAFARIWTVSPDEKMLVLQASSGIYTHRDGPHGLIPIDKALKIPTIARTRKPHLTNAVIGDPQVDQGWAVREGMVAFAGYPLLVGAQLVGVMGCFSRKMLNDFTLNALEAVANNIALGIERLLSQAALKRYSEELSALSIASNDLLALSNLQEIYDGICRFAVRVFGVELVWLGLIDAGGVEVRIAGSAGTGVSYLRTLKMPLDDSPLGRGPTGLAIRSRQPWLARKDSPEFAPWRAAAEECGFETSLAVPLISPTETGTCIGALNFYSRVPGYFTPDRVRLCQIFANQAAIAIENARLIEGLEDNIAFRTRQYESANSELQHVNRELELRREEAESANRAKSDFLANMSHELRTPLNAIIGFSDVMVRGMSGPLQDKQKEFLGDILSGGRHLLSLINDILDLSKVEAGKMEIDPSEYDLAELIDRSLVLFREKAVKHRLDLKAEIEDTIAPVFGDERKIRQVMYNLLSNAAKFTPDGGSIVVRANMVREAGSDYVEIAVSDTGIGISPADQKRLFQPFSQIGHHLTKRHEGTGLGLALCKSFVDMHRGRIGVESAPGQGSTFTFRIPLRFARGSDV